MSCLEQKDSLALKPNRTMVKIACPVCRYWHRTSPHWIREAGVGSCHACGAQMYPARFDDCLDLCPDLVTDHPDYEAYLKAGRHAHTKSPEYGSGEGFCGSCDWRRPANADEDYWFCRKCGHINDRTASGKVATFKAAPFSREAERANGLANSIPF